MATARLTRRERKANTRSDLLAAARHVFLRRGFHAASLDEIAEKAGYTKGAVYSNFTGKDDLFIALLDEHYADRTRAYAELILEQDEVEQSFRAVARFMLDAYAREPGWWPLLSDFAHHAAHDPELQERLRGTREQFLDALAGIIEALAARQRVAYKVPAREVARGAGALLRGMAFEWVVDPRSETAAFEEMLVAFLSGLLVTPTERSES
jgi:AcrR family transcriptional regulator